MHQQTNMAVQLYEYSTSTGSQSETQPNWAGSGWSRRTGLAGWFLPADPARRLVLSQAAELAPQAGSRRQTQPCAAGS